MSDTTKTCDHAAYVTDNEATNTYGLREIFYDLTVGQTMKLPLDLSTFSLKQLKIWQQ